MAITRLRSPTPRKQSLYTPDVSWRTARAQPLTVPVHSHTVDVFRALDGRRTRRRFRLVAERQLSAFLWYSARSRYSYLDETGRRFESRPAPSAGGCHPHDLLVLRPRRGSLAASMYDPRAHALAELECHKRDLRRFVKHISEAVSPEHGTVVWFIAQPQRTGNHYRFPESLLWRDAGVLIGVMAVVAESLNLAFCPVGATGDPYVAALMATGDNVHGFGGAILGGPFTSSSPPV